MQRLRTRAQFQTVLSGAALARTDHFVLHGCAVDFGSDLHGSLEMARRYDSRETVWCGALLPKRWARNAVTRNAIRRQIYSVLAHFDSPIAPYAFVVRLRGAFDRRAFHSASSDTLKCAVRTELQSLLGRSSLRPRGAP